MNQDNITTARTSVALTKDTISRLKGFAKENKLQMYELVAAMTDVLLDKHEVAKLVIKLAKDRQRAKQEGKDIFSKRVAKLPEPIREKLKAMSIEELEELLK